MRVLISAGPTQEAIDPVRYITNRSSGRMGYALAEAALAAGHQVTLVSGPVQIPLPIGLFKVIHVVSAAEMCEAMLCESVTADVVIMTAAVADYRPKAAAMQKMKKQSEDLVLTLERTIDILAALGERKSSGQILVGFAAETHDLEMYALEKLKRKNLDWIAANVVGLPDRGFGDAENAVTLFSADGRRIVLPLMSKNKLAEEILEYVLR